MSYKFEPENPFKSKQTQDETSVQSDQSKGLEIEHFFSTPGVHPFEQLEWEERSAKITSDTGEEIFKQDNIEVPVSWSQLAIKVVASKYFYGDIGSGQREHSVKQLVHRVCQAITDRGKRDGYFATDADAETFYNELTWLCVNQYGSFNSPVWFNVGLFDVYEIAGGRHNFHWDPQMKAAVACENSYEHPQASACFIQSVKDSMEDIMRLAASEAMLFKHGSGTGTDLSTLRSSKEKLSGGGKPSGPLSFMRVYDQIAAVIKSGGKTRRAAKMQSLKVSHPDIREFITCKTEEEKKAWALIEAGYDGDHNNQAYNSVMFQNSNLSVRVTDEFMQAVEKDAEWFTSSVMTGEKMGEHSARELMQLIAEGARICGDPGVQYDSTINRWHTCPNSGPINASNPCSEYMFIDNSACNLASLNLLKFRKEDGSFDVETFKRAIRLFIIAQEILVDNGSYPDKAITENSHLFRPLGLGYANLGSLVMSQALPYDSDQSRALASAISAIMTGAAYTVSAEIAQIMGTFEAFDKNKDSMLKVINMHRQHACDIPEAHCPDYLRNAARDAWDQALDSGTKMGFRNAQVTVLAPTGTIGFMMDCDTTGIEPDIALVKYKLLAGGGMLKLVNKTVPMGWKLGLKAVAIYRDGSKKLQPVSTKKHKKAKAAAAEATVAARPFRRRLSDTRQSITHKFSVTGHEGYLTVGLYEDGQPGELFITMAKEGSTVGGLMDVIGTCTSMALQYGVPLITLVDKFRHARFEPSGMTSNKEIPFAKSLIDYIFCWLGCQFIPGYAEKNTPNRTAVPTTANKNITTAKQLVEKTKDLAQKISEAKAGTKTKEKPESQDLPESKQPVKQPALSSTNRLAGLASRIKTLVSSGGGQLQSEAKILQEFNAQFEHFSDDAPACDICGSITVRNGTCYKCFNCGNSMGCS